MPVLKEPIGIVTIEFIPVERSFQLKLVCCQVKDILTLGRVTHGDEIDIRKTKMLTFFIFRDQLTFKSLHYVLLFYAISVVSALTEAATGSMDL